MDNRSKHPFAHAAAAWLASNSQDKSCCCKGEPSKVMSIDKVTGIKGSEVNYKPK